MDEDATVKQRGNSKNLKPFKKGQSGNPHGRPRKDRSITQALRELGTQIADITVGGKKNTTKTFDELVALGMHLKAIKGDASMAREIIDRLEGKVPQAIEATGKDGGPIRYARELTDDELDAEIERLRRTRPARREAGAPESAAEST